MSDSIAGSSGVPRSPLRCGRASTILRWLLLGGCTSTSRRKRTPEGSKLILYKAEQPACKSTVYCSNRRPPKR